MKQLICLLLLTVPCLTNAQSSGGIQFAEGLTWDQVKEKAKQEDKYIFIDAYATWCGPCKVMDKKVYPAKDVGDIVNEKFISVKVQMDQTDKDNAYVKQWNAVGQTFNSQYGIEGYPSFLFFSPEGKLLYKQIGMKSTDEFIAIVKEALTDPEARYRKNIDAFKNGKLAYSEMPDLAREARRRKEKDISATIAKSYKKEFLDKQSENEAFTQENLFFVADFSYYILKSNDRYFSFFRHQPAQADSIINRVNHGKMQQIAANVVTLVIKKEEIMDKIYKDNKPVKDPSPDWDKIKKTIERKYGREYVDKFFPDLQIAYSEDVQDWNNYSKYINEKIKKTPPQKGGKAFGPVFSDAWQLNQYAWTLFENCSDRKILREALKWAELSLELEEMPYAIDTKANLLYRIGKVDEAIPIEEKAILLAENSEKKEMEKTLEKMKQGLPTWPQK